MSTSVITYDQNGYASIDTSIASYTDPTTYYDPTSMGTVNVNPSVANNTIPGQGTSGTNWSGVLQSIGSYGTAIASIVTGNPVAVNAQTGQTVGVRGSAIIAPTPSILSGSSGILLLLLVGAVILFVVMDK